MAAETLGEGNDSNVEDGVANPDQLRAIKKAVKKNVFL